MWTRISPFITTAKQFVGAPMPGSSLLCPPAETKAGQRARHGGPGAPGSAPQLPPSPSKQRAGWCRSIPCRPAPGNHRLCQGVKPSVLSRPRHCGAWPRLMPGTRLWALHSSWVAFGLRNHWLLESEHSELIRAHLQLVLMGLKAEAALWRWNSLHPLTLFQSPPSPRRIFQV